MMENLRPREHLGKTYVPEASPANDNWGGPLAMGRSSFPEGAFAHIFKPSRSVTTSGKAGTKGWRLTFERRTAPFIQPLMGWTGGEDTLTQIELSFPTLEFALRYAERQGLPYAVHSVPDDLACPTAVVRDWTLSLDAERSFLSNWTWTDRLTEQPASGGGCRIALNRATRRYGSVPQHLIRDRTRELSQINC